MPEIDSVYCMDALELMHQCAPQSIGAIITDLPYGTTACSWDTIIPFEPLWAAVKHCLKPRGVFVTTASQPFTSALVMSNPKWFRYEWVWEKTMATGFLNAPKMPLNAHDNILVFAEGLTIFNRQLGKGLPYSARTGIKPRDTIKDKNIAGILRQNSGTRHPRTVLKYANNTGLHPTQKPVALYEYLIRTYTQEGETVLDPCCGSGTTGIAARNTKRHYILGDTDAGYVETARLRINGTGIDMLNAKPGDALEDLPLFNLDL